MIAGKSLYNKLLFANHDKTAAIHPNDRHRNMQTILPGNPVYMGPHHSQPDKNAFVYEHNGIDPSSEYGYRRGHRSRIVGSGHH